MKCRAPASVTLELSTFVVAFGSTLGEEGKPQSSDDRESVVKVTPWEQAA